MVIVGIIIIGILGSATGMGIIGFVLGAVFLIILGIGIYVLVDGGDMKWWGLLPIGFAYLILVFLIRAVASHAQAAVGQ